MKKVLILFGGNSSEHNISCKSVNFVTKHIDKDLFEYSIVGIDFDNTWYEVRKKTLIDNNWKNNTTKKISNIIEYSKKFDIVFPVIHGNCFEDGKMQSLFEMYNIKYVGSNSYSSLISYDKLLTKLLLEKYSIPQVPYIIYNQDLDYENIKYPVIVKPCKCGSSIGISVVNNKDKIKKAIDEALKYDSNIIIEKYIENNRELECAILESNNRLVISNIGEILKDSKWYGYEEKYIKKTNTIISNIDDSIKKEIQNYSKKIFEILNCKSLSRIDFLYDLDKNKLYFNEINTMPGFTEISMYPKLIKNSGINSKELITILLNS